MVAIFSDSLMYIVLMSNYHGCKGGEINLIQYYLINVIHKTLKQSYLKK